MEKENKEKEKSSAQKEKRRAGAEAGRLGQIFLNSQKEKNCPCGG